MPISETTTRPRQARRAKLLLAAVAAMAVGLMLSAATASAIVTHPTKTDDFEVGSNAECPNGTGELAVDETRDLIYVVCFVSPARPVIKRFHFNGNPAPFEFSAPYIVGNVIVGNPLSPTNTWQAHQFTQTYVPIAVNNGPVNNGQIIISAGCPACGPGTGHDHAEIFRPSGEWIRELPKPEFGQVRDVAYGPDGSLFTLVDFLPNIISRYDPVSLGEVERLLPTDAEEFVRPESDGDVWAGKNTAIFIGTAQKFEKSTFTTDLSVKLLDFLCESCPIDYVEPSPYVSPSGGLGPELVAQDVDTTDDTIYTLTFGGNGIETWYGGSPEEYAFENGPKIGVGEITGQGPNGLDVTKDGNLYVSQGREVWTYAPGDILPNVRTPAPDIDEMTRTQATLHARIDKDGGTAIVSCQLEYDTSKAAVQNGTATGIIPCAGGPFTSEETPVSATTVLPLSTGTTYYYRFKATNLKGSNTGGVREFAPPHVPKLHTEAAEVNEPGAATLHGSFDPSGKQVDYYFEYGPDTSYGQKTPTQSGGSGSGKVDVEADLSDLPSGRIFHFRLVGFTSEGSTFGEDLTFRTASAPEIAGVTATEVTANSATLNARIDPVGYDTEYRFEYGTTTAYGSSVPVPDEAIGNSNGYVPVKQAIAGLQEGVTYHFRVVAKNKWGESVSEDTTFDFAPPACPNAHARQVTGTNYLPDCRAYEIVSPADAGAIFYFPHNQLPTQLLTQQKPFWLWPQNNGLANNPSRFAFYGALGSPDGVDVPNSTLDLFVATRTESGWVQSAPELQGSEVLYAAEKQCSEDLSLCYDHVTPDALGGTFPGQSAPYLFDLSGKALGQLPTNVNVVENGKFFTGDQRASGTFSDLAISSTDAIFTTDGIPSSGTHPGSAYLNDLAQKTMKLISRNGAGEHIPRDVSLNNFNNPGYIRFPGISPDGSHVLMSVNGKVNGVQSSGAIHMYMYVDGAVPVTYDVTRGVGATLVGMSRDGSRVFFIARDKVTADDKDTSDDLFMWSEAGDTVTRISRISPADEAKLEGESKPVTGNTNSCSSTFSTACGVANLTTLKGPAFNWLSNPALDERVSKDGSDAYFYSPELLDPNKAGIPGQKNLYVYRDGAIQLVATLESNEEQQIRRIQLSPDGDRVGLVSASRLTGFDNNGKEMMYTYNPETGVIRCASCKPSGLPPSNNVEGSQGGPFMTDDGRVFFTTRDALVPEDANGNINDVYEFVNGRPQLITSGTGGRDTTGAGFLFPATRTGLESVSSDGRDVFFSTFETLVDEDVNGPFVKFYDARTGGGFDFQYELAPCEAADECHGETSAPPPAPRIGTRNDLGASGNIAAPAKKKAKKKKKKKAQRKRAQRKRANAKRNGKNARRNHG